MSESRSKMTVGELRDFLRDLPDNLEVGIESSVGYLMEDGTQDWDGLQGHAIRGAYRMDFRDEEKGVEVVLLMIDREEESAGRWQL